MSPRAPKIAPIPLWEPPGDLLDRARDAGAELRLDPETGLVLVAGYGTLSPALQAALGDERDELATLLADRARETVLEPPVAPETPTADRIDLPPDVTARRVTYVDRAVEAGMPTGLPLGPRPSTGERPPWYTPSPSERVQRMFLALGLATIYHDNHNGDREL
jgi:hypothetical protein